MAVEFKDYYSTLGVSKTATEKELKAAYRKLARKHHPDVNPGDPSAEGKFKELNEAYEVLGDADKRRKYDELGANWKQYEQAGSGGPFGGGAWNVNTGPGGYRTMSPEEMEQMFGGGGAGGADPFSDFFNTFFGGGGGGQDRRTHRPRTRKGRDVEHDIELTLEDAFQGATRRLAMQDEGRTRTVDVRIPAGVKDGARVRAAGEGESGAHGGSSGDLFLRVRLRPHGTFERRGQDLHTKVAVPLVTAVLGGEVAVPTMAGGTLRLKVPELTQNGQVFRLRGQGMPAVGKPDTRGDLYATADIAMPRTLSDRERTLWEQLKQPGSAEPATGD
ncbi:MAG: DnaJ domain-containing protein [Acidobacteriota bacterium]|nr:DnaJ domain-containing protein [Acidobacteriota bacterium]